MKGTRICILFLILFGLWILPVGCSGGGGSTPATPPPVPTTVPLAQQVQNPVALFTTDNNGVIIALPSVTSPTGTATSLTGSLVFGIKTQTNNQLTITASNTFYLDSFGYIYTNFKGSINIPSFIDSGSNGYFFQDAAITLCASSSIADGFYCTSGPNDNTLDPLPLTATITDKTNTSPTVNFSVGDAVYMLNTYPSDYVFSNLGAPISDLFDWGLPFFYGSNVYTSITANGNGSYFAFLPYTAPSVTTNVQPIYVNGGPTAGSSEIYVNGAFTSVTVCVPGSTPPSTQCKTIDGVLVDTGSSGLRLLSSALTLSLPAEQIGGDTLGECVQFADGSYIWGSVRTADVYLGGSGSPLTGEVAHSVPIHILDSTFSTLPSDCSGTYEADDLYDLGANGILGIGSTQYDCSVGGTNLCVSTPQRATYYKCP